MMGFTGILEHFLVTVLSAQLLAAEGRRAHSRVPNSAIGLFNPADNLGRANAEDSSDFEKRPQRRIPKAAFQQRHVGSIQLCRKREIGLGKLRLLTNCPQDQPNDLGEPLFGLTLRARIAASPSSHRRSPQTKVQRTIVRKSDKEFQ